LANPEIVTRTVRVVLRPDGIVITTNLPNQEHTLADAKTNMEAIGRLAGGIRVPLIVDSRIPANIANEAKKYYASADAAKFVTACAIIASGVLTRVVANLVIPRTKQNMPMKLFASEADAVSWLHSQPVESERRV
jgi:hypothetical protein